MGVNNFIQVAPRKKGMVIGVWAIITRLGQKWPRILTTSQQSKRCTELLCNGTLNSSFWPFSFS